jgi:Sec-independent protein translocase protein (TatC)
MARLALRPAVATASIGFPTPGPRTTPNTGRPEPTVSALPPGGPTDHACRIEILQAPAVEINHARSQLIALNLSGAVSALDLQIRISLFIGTVLSSPWWVYRLWAFISPDLIRRERLVTVFVDPAVPAPAERQTITPRAAP